MRRQFALSALLVLAAAPTLAASSPFGVGLQDSGGGGGLIPWVAALQADFYRDLTAALGAMRDNGQAFWWLGGLSFAYGVVHAAGPGHGKFVISSYLLANEERARRGVALAFLSAMAQAVVAVGIVGLMAAALNMTSVAITDTARVLEVGSYALIAALGLYLLARKAGQARRAFGFASAGAHVHGGQHFHGHGHGHGQSCGCHGHHAPSLKGGATAAVLSVGLRPCSGALIVLVFALAQGIFWAGVASTFLMALGTAVTVAALAVLAVTAKDLAARWAGADGTRSTRVLVGLELLGALAITALGAVLLLGALSA